MNKEKGSRFNNTIKPLSEYENERIAENKDYILGKQILRESNPKAVKNHAERETKENFLKSRLNEPKKKVFGNGETILEKRWILYTSKLKDSPANLYRHLVSTRVNITRIINCLNFNLKIDVHDFHYRRSAPEKQVLRQVYRLNKIKDEKELTEKKHELLLTLFMFREKMILKIFQLEKELIKKKVNMILENPKEKLFYDEKKEKLIIEPVEEKYKGPRRFNTILIDEERHREKQLF